MKRKLEIEVDCGIRTCEPGPEKFSECNWFRPDGRCALFGVRLDETPEGHLRAHDCRRHEKVHQ